jgi:uncharacterized Zn finger protein
MMRSPIECPYCGHQFEDAIDVRLRKKAAMTIEETMKAHMDFEFAEEGLSVDETDTIVLDDDGIETDIDVIKIKELGE